MKRFWIPQRVDETEWLDQQRGTEQEIDRSLRDLSFIYRWLGGRAIYRSTLWRALARWPPGQPAKILDVAAGGGDALRDLHGFGGTVGISLRLYHLDRNEWPLRWARQRTREEGSLFFVKGDALRLPFRDESFDFVISSLFLHHICDRAEEVVTEFLRVTRYAVVINDLLRHRLPLWFLRVLGPLFMRSPITRHDGPVSIRRALWLSEVRELARRMPGYRHQFRIHWTFRFGWMIWKRPLPTS